MKEFDEWNKRKKKINQEFKEVYGYQGEIWWCSLGVNIGAETDGKNKNFERPVIIMRVYNQQGMLILPLTSKKKDDAFHFKVSLDPTFSAWVKLTQARVISGQRLIRKMRTLSRKDFINLQEAFKKYL